MRCTVRTSCAIGMPESWRCTRRARVPARGEGRELASSGETGRRMWSQERTISYPAASRKPCRSVSSSFVSVVSLVLSTPRARAKEPPTSTAQSSSAAPRASRSGASAETANWTLVRPLARSSSAIHASGGRSREAVPSAATGTTTTWRRAQDFSPTIRERSADSSAAASASKRRMAAVSRPVTGATSSAWGTRVVSRPSRAAGSAGGK